MKKICLSERQIKIILNETEKSVTCFPHPFLLNQTVQNSSFSLNHTVLCPKGKSPLNKITHTKKKQKQTTRDSKLRMAYSSIIWN